MSTEKLIHDGFLDSVAQFPERSALEVGGCAISYCRLYELAARIGATLARDDNSNEPALTGLFAYRSVCAFAGVLGILFRGHGYVPLSRTVPIERNREILKRSECNALVVDDACTKQLDGLLLGLDRSLVIVMPEQDSIAPFAAKWPRHHFIGANEMENHTDFTPVRVGSDAVSYLLFTSGSTGTPKGVMVAHRNARSYLDFVVPRYGISENDRCSQTFEMTFDLSVHDMFVTWDAGACLCCPSQRTLINPGKFILQAELTTWFSVPSTAIFMKKLGALKAGLYPSLRLSLFCGEALPMEVAIAWGNAAPNAVIENIYGPTELTIACTAYRWHPQRSPSECHLDIAPIGIPFHEMDAIVVDSGLTDVPIGAPGELLMAGPQVTPGYWRDAELTRTAFVSPPGRTRTYYRTGDRVIRPAVGKPLLYLGRMDNQIKLLGHRVELGEIEAVVRKESGIDAVVAVGWPVSAGGADGVEVFLQGEGVDSESLLARLADKLPSYMVPRRIHLQSVIPLNANGKFDRKALLQTLETSQR